LIVGIVNFLTMPKYFYPGDALAIKLSAINLLTNNDLGISYSNRDRIEDFFAVPGHGFHDNASKRKYYSRWGFINTIIFAVPELMNSKNVIEIDNNTIFYHNCFNVATSILIAIYLFNIGCLYSRSIFSKIFYTLMILYSTFYWNYLRAQSYDILQILFFLAFYYHFISYRRKICSSRSDYLMDIIASNVALVLLVLSKNFFAFVYAGIALNYFFNKNKEGKRFVRLEGYCHALSIALLMLTIIISNNYLYSTYVFTKNASHDPYNPTIIPFSTGHYTLNIKRYLFGIQSNLLLHFPPLIFSPLGLSTFYKNYREDFTFISIVCLISSLLLGAFYSRGEWCYGPRFFLFILPLLSLPLIIFTDEWISNIKTVKNSLFMTVIGILQVNVNSRHFFTKYYLEGAFSFSENLLIKDYFNESHFGTIISNFNTFMRNKNGFFPVEILAQDLDAVKREELINNIWQQFSEMQILQPNLYFTFK
jgi:hypothetical protein